MLTKAENRVFWKMFCRMCTCPLVTYPQIRTYGHTCTHKNVRGITMASHCAVKHTTMAERGEAGELREGERGVCVCVEGVPGCLFIRSKCVNKLKCDGSSRSNKSCKMGHCCFVMPQISLNPSLVAALHFQHCHNIFRKQKRRHHHAG